MLLLGGAQNRRGKKVESLGEMHERREPPGGRRGRGGKAINERGECGPIEDGNMCLFVMTRSMLFVI